MVEAEFYSFPFIHLAEAFIQSNLPLRPLKQDTLEQLKINDLGIVTVTLKVIAVASFSVLKLIS